MAQIKLDSPWPRSSSCAPPPSTSPPPCGSGRRLIGCRGFEDDEAGPAAFQNLLRSAAGVPVYLMADTVDEDYRFETLPHASGSDRREMVERKLKQLYRSTPFYGASLQEREGDKRRDDRYLFAALTNPEIFNPWLQILLAAKAPIAGVFPLPMVSLGADQAARAAASPTCCSCPSTTPACARPSSRTSASASAGSPRCARASAPTAGLLRRGDPQHAHVPGCAERHARGRCRHRRDRRQDGSLQRWASASCRVAATCAGCGIGQQELIAKVGVDRAALEAQRRRPAPASAGPADARLQPGAAHAHGRLQPLSGQPLDLRWPARWPPWWASPGRA